MAVKKDNRECMIISMRVDGEPNTSTVNLVDDYSLMKGTGVPPLFVNQAVLVPAEFPTRDDFERNDYVAFKKVGNLEGDYEIREDFMEYWAERTPVVEETPTETV